MISGGVAPGGNWRNSVWEIAVTCAFAVRISTFGWKKILTRRGDAAGHLVRRQASIAPDHADDGNADFREDVRGRPECGERADDQKQQGQHDEGVRLGQGDAHQGNHEVTVPDSLSAIILTGEPLAAVPLETPRLA